MASKLVLIVAVACLAQGFAMKLSAKGGPRGGPQGPKMPLPPCKAEEAIEDIPHDFEEAVHDMDEIRESVSMAAMDSYINRQDPRVVIACFAEQKDNYVKLGEQIEERMQQAVEDFAEELGEKFDEYKELAAEPIRNIAAVFRELPVKTWELIKNEGFNKALEYMRQSRRVVEENSKKLREVIREMGKEFPEAAERASEIVKEIRREAREGSQAIAKAIEKCIEEGGPKN